MSGIWYIIGGLRIERQPTPLDTFGEGVFSGHLFVFVSKRRDRCKILVWDDGGFVLYSKRLESGRFKLPVMDATSTSVSLNSGQLVMLLGGFDTAHLQRQKLWTPRQRF